MYSNGVDWFDLNIFNSFYRMFYVSFFKHNARSNRQTIGTPKGKFSDRGPTRLSHAHQLV
jgi:hypothetical protein